MLQFHQAREKFSKMMEKRMSREDVYQSVCGRSPRVYSSVNLLHNYYPNGGGGILNPLRWLYHFSSKYITKI